jgi:NAD(P)-dependent dehydrogenase (short-subunit alcohol dehydrogenase family)
VNTPLTEQTILVTGATDGIGKGTARELARRGTRVLLHGRNAERAAAARDEIAAATGNDRLETYVADFASLRDVHRLAEQVSARHDCLHVLINNAGIGAGPRGDRSSPREACCSTLLIAMKRLSGRPSAAQIACASRASVLLRLTNGFTYAVGISRTWWPNARSVRPQ